MEDLNKITEEIIGCAIEVHKKLGPGFLESVYQKALCRELELQNIAFAYEVPINVHYKGLDISDFRIDLLVENKIVVELKAVENLHPIHSTQLLSYLKATGLKLGLLINFNEMQLINGLKRVIHGFL